MKAISSSVGLEKGGKAKRKVKKNVNGSGELPSFEQSAWGFLARKDGGTAGIRSQCELLSSHGEELIQSESLSYASLDLH